MNYTFEGLSREQTKEYILSKLEFANVHYNLFKEDAFNALYANAQSSPRMLNNLVNNCLMIGFQNNLKTIDSDIVMNAKMAMEI